MNERYFVISGTEDGMCVILFDSKEALLKQIAAENSPDISPDCRTKYVTATQGALDGIANGSMPNTKIIIRGDHILPHPVQTVTEYTLE